MNPPSLIFVGNHAYSVTFGKIRRAGQALLGLTKASKSRIWLDDTVARSVQQETALHETLHAIFNSVGLRLDSHVEENIVVTITPELLKVLRRNPELLKYLLEE